MKQLFHHHIVAQTDANKTDSRLKHLYLYRKSLLTRLANLTCHPFYLRLILDNPETK